MVDNKHWPMLFFTAPGEEEDTTSSKLKKKKKKEEENLQRLFRLAVVSSRGTRLSQCALLDVSYLEMQLLLWLFSCCEANERRKAQNGRSGLALALWH